MGYNATVVVLLDRLDEIENDPEFGKKLSQAIIERSSFPEHRFITGQTEVVSVAHADVMQVVAVGSNTGQVIGYGHWRDVPDDLIKKLYFERQREKRLRRERARAEFVANSEYNPNRS